MAKHKKRVQAKHLAGIINYFQNTINSGKLRGNKNDVAFQQMVAAFEKINLNSKTNSLSALQKWIDKYINDLEWKRALSTLHQKNYLKKNPLLSIKISKTVHDKLLQCTKHNNTTFDKLLNTIADYELANIAYRKQRAEREEKDKEKEKRVYKEKTRKIGNVFNKHLEYTKNTTDVTNILYDLDKFFEDVNKNNIISGEVDCDKIVHNDPIKIPWNAYMSYADAIAGYVAQRTGTYNIFLVRGLPREYKYVFVGMADNVEMSDRLFRLLFKQAKLAKSEYMSELSNRMKKTNRTKRANEFIREWARYFDCIGCEEELYTDDGYDILDKFAKETWPSMKRGV